MMPAQRTEAPVLQYRSIFLSDLHLGTYGCQAEAILDFLRHTESQYLYLVGDVIDAWQLKRRWYWPQTHNDVIQKILRRVRKGSKVFFVPGNHDEFLRDFCGLQFGGVFLEEETVHTATDGKRYLVVHGDQFDSVMRYAKWLAKLGDVAYTTTLVVNAAVNKLRRKFGFSYWSLSAYLKNKVKNAVVYISDYEAFISGEARRHRVDGVVCGHIHHAEMRQIDGIAYCNAGDWVESCTALVEDFEGRMFLINWFEDKRNLLALYGKIP